MKFRDDIHQTKSPQNNVYKELNSHPNLTSEVPKAGEIFLGCLPMIFTALSYLYWRCDSQGNGEWSGFSLTGSGSESHLKDFMVASGFKKSELNEKKQGYQIFENNLQDKFKDFTDAISMAGTAAKERADKEDKARKNIYAVSRWPYLPNEKPSYSEFVSNLHDNGKEKFGNGITTSANQNSLSILYHISYLYFRGRHIMLSESSAFKPRTPSTIREMLYFMASLPFSPSYDSLNEHISNLFRTLSHVSSSAIDAEYIIPVADSGNTSPYNTLTAADLKDYLTTSCSLSITLLGTIQGPGASENSEPWLHELFCNNAFHLICPSGPTLFHALSNYTYALQFQLYFLYAQCYSTYSQGRGWRGCKFGSGVHSPEKPAESHICRKSDNSNTHNDQCGVSTLSPLQAFLTDNVKGFSVTHNSDSSSSSHFDNHPPGSMCHVNMGFTTQSLRQSAGTGNYIYSVLIGFCGRPDTPLRQLSEKLGCLTKRTPRTLGDVFGFLWHLNDQMFKTRPKMETLAKKLVESLSQNNPHKIPSFFMNILNDVARNASPPPSAPSTPTVLSRSLEAMAPAIPFFYQLFMAEEPNTLPGALFDLTKHCHKWEGGEYKHESDPNSSIGKHTCHNHPSDLWGLYNSVWDETMHKDCRSKNCGGYLEPLTLTDGAAFSPSSAPAYLSWIAYLTDDFYDQLSEMRDEFNNISCDNCKNSCQNEKSCHATSGSGCNCTSVVSCAGVLPLLYRHGFQFYDAYSLNGLKWENRTKSWKPDSTIQRSCQKFHTQLSNVLAENAPLAKLLESIDNFLYLFRFYFVYNLSSFWLCSLLVLLYLIFYGIDVLHFKSHANFPSSHTVPRIGLLTTGKAPALTTLTYYMP